MTADPTAPQWSQPTRLGAAVFAAKCAVYRARRHVVDLMSGPAKHGRADAEPFPVVLWESRTPLWSDAREAERAHQRGKVHNLRRAARSLDGVLIPAGQVFSFWRQIGPATEARGYASGRMLQQGCLVPATGGGLCQLSNALYETALQSGCEIVERHGHSRVVPGSAAAVGRDATVAWNYVDLRFRPKGAMLIEAKLTADALVLRFRGGPDEVPAVASGTRPRTLRVREDALPLATPGAAPKVRTCSTCDQIKCFRHDAAHRPTPEAGVRTAFLLDENWPEFQAYVAEARRGRDVLGVPFDGGRLTPPRYRWPAEGFGHTGSAGLAALARAWAIRRAGAQGPARREAELDGAAAIARRLARLAGPEIEHLVVAQSLLPFLWREGELGGRSFSVLMTRLPIEALHARLDQAFAAHPDRSTLGDFRAPAWLARAETEALAAAQSVVTPHTEVARLFPGRTVALTWRAPPAMAGERPPPQPRRIAFPGPTVARKGVYDLREAARALDLEVVLMGSELEGAGFWDGVRTLRPDPAAPGGWLEGVAAVVQPALVEDQPRRLLAALGAGAAVVATAACGLAPQPGLTLTPQDDPQSLTRALREVLDL
jgi:hypothetical protein